LFITCKSSEPGPISEPYLLQTAWWNGAQWEIRTVSAVDHHDDGGCLWVDAKKQWRLLAPTEPGPFPYYTGGEMVPWMSVDQGRNWTAAKPLTTSTDRHQCFPRRPVGAQPGFAAFWADGDPRQTSESSLYFTDESAQTVWRLPAVMDSDSAAPEPVVLEPTGNESTQP
jgi:hypothetical protein